MGHIWLVAVIFLFWLLSPTALVLVYYIFTNPRALVDATKKVVLKIKPQKGIPVAGNNIYE